MPGGGVALIRCKDEVEKVCNMLVGDEKTGAQIVLNSLCSPIKQICENAGLDSGVIIEKILSNASKAAKDIMGKDPSLTSEENKKLKAKLYINEDTLLSL